MHFKIDGFAAFLEASFNGVLRSRCSGVGTDTSLNTILRPLYEHILIIDSSAFVMCCSKSPHQSVCIVVSWTENVSVNSNMDLYTGSRNIKSKLFKRCVKPHNEHTVSSCSYFALKHLRCSLVPSLRLCAMLCLPNSCSSSSDSIQSLLSWCLCNTLKMFHKSLKPSLSQVLWVRI